MAITRSSCSCTSTLPTKVTSSLATAGIDIGEDIEDGLRDRGLAAAGTGNRKADDLGWLNRQLFAMAVVIGEARYRARALRPAPMSCTSRLMPGWTSGPPGWPARCSPQLRYRARRRATALWRSSRAGRRAQRAQRAGATWRARRGALLCHSPAATDRAR